MTSFFPYSNKRIPRVHGSDAEAIYKRAIASTGAPFRLSVQCSHTYDPSTKPGSMLNN